MSRLSIAGKSQYKFLDIIFCVFIALQLVCDILVMRVITVGFISFTASSIIFCIDFFLIDVIANVYGMNAARRISFLNFFCQILFAGLLYAFLTDFRPNISLGQMYFNNAIQIRDFGLIVSRNMFLIPIAVLVGNLSNSLLMTLSKYLFFGKFIAFRSVMSSLFGALLMLGISYTKIYWSFGLSYIFKLVLSSMIIKMIGTIILMLPTRILSNFLKDKEGVDVYDLKFKFLQKRQLEISEKNRS